MALPVDRDLESTMQKVWICNPRNSHYLNSWISGKWGLQLGVFERFVLS